MEPIANTPKPPYYCVTFTSFLKPDDVESYYQTAAKMLELASVQPGFLGYETARGENGLGITISYWQDLESIKNWKQHPEHVTIQQRGLKDWYQQYRTRICKVESDTSFLAD